MNVVDDAIAESLNGLRSHLRAEFRSLGFSGTAQEIIVPLSSIMDRVQLRLDNLRSLDPSIEFKDPSLDDLKEKLLEQNYSIIDSKLKLIVVVPFPRQAHSR